MADLPRPPGPDDGPHSPPAPPSGPGGRARSGLIGTAGAAPRAAHPGYSRFVRALRFILPLLAIGIIGLILSWPKVEDTMDTIPREAGMPQTVARNELVEPRYEGADEKNQPFSITARRAVQSAQDPDTVLLEAPRGESVLNGATRLHLSADKGEYQQKAGKLLLEGNVTLTQGAEYEFRTDKLLVHLKAREAWSDSPVAGKGPAGTLEASGLHAQGADSLLIFTGPARLVLSGPVAGL